MPLFIMEEAGRGEKRRGDRAIARFTKTEFEKEERAKIGPP